jgi:hypothetical protein
MLDPKNFSSSEDPPEPSMNKANDGRLQTAACQSPTHADKRGHQQFHLLPIGMSGNAKVAQGNGEISDRHVLAAAIHCKADVIVTFNLKDFPPENLSKFDIEVQHPDEFIHHQFGLNHAGVLTAVRRCRNRLKNPAKTAEEYLTPLRPNPCLRQLMCFGNMRA